MRRLFVQIYVVLGILLLAAANAQSLAPAKERASSPVSGSFQGIFVGTAFSDRDSSARLTLNLTQKGNAVDGTAKLGVGLAVDTGGLLCPGVVAIPSGMIDVKGTISPSNPSHLEARSNLSALDLVITALMIADLSKDGNIMNVQIKLNIPWPCKSATIKAILARNLYKI
jgi:hypothetical protein